MLKKRTNPPVHFRIKRQVSISPCYIPTACCIRRSLITSLWTDHTFFFLKGIREPLKTAGAGWKLLSNMMYSPHWIGFCRPVLLGAQVWYATSFHSKPVTLASDLVPCTEISAQLPKNLMMACSCMLEKQACKDRRLLPLHYFHLKLIHDFLSTGNNVFMMKYIYIFLTTVKHENLYKPLFVNW